VLTKVGIEMMISMDGHSKPCWYDHANILVSDNMRAFGLDTFSELDKYKELSIKQSEP
jgi:hypothetical protein